MSNSLDNRLNHIYDRITADDFLKNSGASGEIGFHIFDYPPADELRVRSFISTLLDQLTKRRPDLTYTHINLFELVVQYLTDRKLLDRAYGFQKNKGDDELLKALKGPLHEQKIAQYLVEARTPNDNDLIFISGIGSCWPLIRSHTLLNSLHPFIDKAPLILFYPGKYDGQGLRLFGKLNESNYYRAFQLIS